MYSSHPTLITLFFILFFTFTTPFSHLKCNQNETHHKTNTIFIKEITIEAKEILDSSDNFPFSNLINSLHIRTKNNFIKQELLFQQHKKTTKDIIYESERNLRNLSIFSDVKILPTFFQNDSSKICVITRDKWSTKLNTSYKLQGGVHYWGISLIEDNLLGYGKMIDLSYNHSTERILRQLIWADTRLLGSRYNTYLKLQNNSDIRMSDIKISKPFFAWHAKWGFTFQLENINGIYKKYLNDHIISTPQQHIRTQRLIFNFYRGNYLKHNYMFGAIHKKEIIEDQSNKLTLLGCGYGIMKRSYKKYTTINFTKNTEDLATGFSSEAVMGFNFKNSEPYFLSRFRYANSNPNKLSYYFRSLFQSFYAKHAIKNMFFENEIKIHKLFSNNLIVSRISWTQIKNFNNGRELQLGEKNGVRGVENISRTGTKRFLINIEDHIFTDINVLLFKLGFAVFMDIGSAWSESSDINFTGLKKSFGFGLRIGNSRFTKNITRIDFAFNYSDKRWQISIGNDSYFSAATSLGFLSDFRIDNIINLK